MAWVGSRPWPILMLLAGLEQLARLERTQERDRFRALRSELDEMEKAADEFWLLTQTLVQAALLAQGCHTHKGQWRRNGHGTHTHGSREPGA